MTIDQKLMLDRSIMDDPYHFYDQLRSTSPVWKASHEDIYVVTSFDLLAEAARRIDDFSSVIRAFLYKGDDDVLARLPVDLGSPTLAVADPPTHTQHKQLIFPKFVSKRMMQIEDELTAYAEACIDRTIELGSFDFMSEIGLAVPIRAIAMLIGFVDRNDALLSKTALDLEEITSCTKTMAEMAQAQLNQDEIRGWMQSQLDQRAGGETEHLLDAVKTAVMSGQLKPDEAMTTLMTLLAAGGGSTAALLGNAVRLLAESPDVRRALQSDMSMLPAFIDEAGRLESPFRSHMRSVPHDTELGGTHIPEGSTVLLMWGAANRDPAKFDNPNAINYGRKLQHVTFGRGIHLCVGAALARMEARIVLGALLKRDRFPTLSASERPEWDFNMLVRRHSKLPMEWAS